MRSSSAALALTTVLSLATGAAAQPEAPAAPEPPAAPAAPVAPVAPTPPAPVAAPAAPAASGSASRPSTPLANAEQIRRGVVRLERGARPLALGMVLRADGRILTALSPLGHGNFVQARFADDSVVSVRVVLSDRAWDLALLAPEGAHWTEGLRPSTLDAPEVGASLHRFRVRGSRLEEASIGVAARQAVLGRDGVMLSDVLALAPRPEESELGAPLFDDRGDVAAIVVQACALGNAQSCQLTGYGAPVSALKQFLKRAPRREALPAAYVGLRGVAAHDGAVAGVRVVAVDPGSPAERAGLSAEKPGRAAGDASRADLIVAVEDVPVATPDELRDALNRFAFAASGAPAADAQKSGADAAGERDARLLVFGAGKFREVKLAVRAPRQLPAATPPPGQDAGHAAQPAAPAPPAPASTAAPASAAETPAP